MMKFDRAIQKICLFKDHHLKAIWSNISDMETRAQIAQLIKEARLMITLVMSELISYNSAPTTLFRANKPNGPFQDQ